MKTRIILIICLITGIAVHLSANEKIYINREVTTHIVMPENIKMVDISTTKIIGNQCTDNIVRIKPYLENDSISSEGYSENELLGTLTIIGERHIAQYDILYTESPQYASTIYNVSYNETQSYINPEVSMPMAEIARYAWAVYGSRRKFNQIVSDKNGIRAYINNIYSIGDYFFLDYTLNNTRKFKKDYRNVLVLPKLTFPEEKVLRLEISENQISGRVVVLTIEYEDILNADGFDSDILDGADYYPYYYIDHSIKR